MPGVLLSLPLIARIRRNHALEHATIHVLHRRRRDLRIVGRSTPTGFVLYADLSTDEVHLAAQEALTRLRAGQWELAIHPTCGTNLATSGLLAGLGAFAVLTPRRRSLDEWLGRLPLVILVTIIGFLLGQRLGTLLQARVTTDPQMGEATIARVVRQEQGPLLVHRVVIEG